MIKVEWASVTSHHLPTPPHPPPDYIHPPTTHLTTSTSHLYYDGESTIKICNCSKKIPVDFSVNIIVLCLPHCLAWSPELRSVGGVKTNSVVLPHQRLHLLSRVQPVVVSPPLNRKIIHVAVKHFLMMINNHLKLIEINRQACPGYHDIYISQDYKLNYFRF